VHAAKQDKQIPNSVMAEGSGVGAAEVRATSLPPPGGNTNMTLLPPVAIHTPVAASKTDRFSEPVTV
jgi:hypothetical protein